MNASIEIRDRTGKNVLGLLSGLSAVGDIARTWIDNGVGTGSFTISKSNPLASIVLAWGNVFLISEIDLLPWVGVITDRERARGTVKCTLASAEWLLKDQYSGYVSGSTSIETSGALIKSVCASALHAVANYNPITLGTFDASRMATGIYHYEDILPFLQNSANKYYSHFWVGSDFKLNFSDVRGVDLRSTVTFNEDKELVNVVFKESAKDQYNAGIGVGGPGNFSTKTLVGEMIPSTGLFRTQKFTDTSITDPTELRKLITDNIQQTYLPSQLLSADIVNDNHAWRNVAIGNKLMMSIKESEVAIPVQIIGIDVATGGVLHATFKTINSGNAPTPSKWSR